MSEEERPGVEDTQPTGETPASSSQGTPAPATEEPSAPGRLARWIGRALRWAAGLSVVFVLGVALVWFMRVRPQTQELRTLGQTLQETKANLDSVQAEVEKLRGLEDENANLQDQLVQSQQHLSLLSVLVDVTTAQLALAEDDPVAAEAALKGTDKKLETIESGVEGDSATAAKAMRDRLATALDELAADDQFAAKRDLEVIANSLVDLEGALFPTAIP
jgi:uncharacterized membrane-anchored protein YhcB (DUF1043 family)